MPGPQPRASVPEETGPVLTSVTVVTHQLTCKDVQVVKLVYVNIRLNLPFWAWFQNPRALAM